MNYLLFILLSVSSMFAYAGPCPDHGNLNYIINVRSLTEPSYSNNFIKLQSPYFYRNFGNLDDDCGIDVTAIRIIDVDEDDDIQAALASLADSGGVLRVRHGRYPQLNINDMKQTADNPIYIVGVNQPMFGGKDTTFGVRIENSSYIHVSGLRVQYAIEGFAVYTSDFIIFDGNYVEKTRQGAFMVRIGSNDVDFKNNIVRNTGVGSPSNPQWSEGFYVGGGHSHGSGDREPEVNRVWISGNHIRNTGCAEAINVKTESFNVSIINNKISNITPGCIRYEEQSNMAAISLEPGAPDNPYKASVLRHHWVVGNRINNVYHDGKHDWGIVTTGMGSNIIGNILTNIHGFPIKVIEWGSYGGYTNIFGNIGEISTRGGEPYNVAGPENINKPQSWPRLDQEALELLSTKL